MTQQYQEKLLDDNDQVIFEVTADTDQRGTAMTEHGIWYSPAQVTQIIDMLTRASTFINERAE